MALLGPVSSPQIPQTGRTVILDLRDKGSGAQRKQVTCLRTPGEWVSWASWSSAPLQPATLLSPWLTALLWEKILAKTLVFLSGTSL